MRPKNIRISKQKKGNVITLEPKSAAERAELDKNVVDLVLRMLYENADKNSLDLQKDIFDKSRIALPRNETQRLWDILTGSGWVSPSIGFGKAGKLELTKAGFQMMSQFGGYAQYLTSVLNSNQPQTIILPIQVEGEEATDAERKAG